MVGVYSDSLAYMGICLARQHDVVVVEDYTTYKSPVDANNVRSLSPDHNQSSSKYSHSHNHAKNSPLKLKQSTSSCSAVEDGDTSSSPISLKKTADICMSLSSSSQVSSLKNSEPHTSHLEAYVRAVASNCHSLPTTPRDDSENSTVHALSPTAYRFKCQAFVPADVRLICAFPEYKNVKKQGVALHSKLCEGGCIVPAFLSVVNKNRTKALSFAEVLNKMDESLYSSLLELNHNNFQTRYCVQIMSSVLDLDVAYHIIRPACKGNRRAILVGKNNDDLGSLMTYLVDVHNFLVQDIAVLQKIPDNVIRQRFRMLCEECTAGDSVFCYLDGSTALSEGDIFASLIGPMPPGITLTLLVDSFKIDLPYVYEANISCDNSPRMSQNNDFSFLRVVQFLRNQCEMLPSKNMYRSEIDIFENFIKATQTNIEARKMLTSDF